MSGHVGDGGEMLDGRGLGREVMLMGVGNHCDGMLVGDVWDAQG